MKLIAGFLNTEKNICGCNRNYYSLPVKEGDVFHIIVENEVGTLTSSFLHTLVGAYGSRKIYRFIVNGIANATSVNNFLTWQRNIAAYCASEISEYCEEAFASMCEGFGSACFRYADCFDGFLSWEQRFGWYPFNNGWFAFQQRLPIRLIRPQPKIEGLKTYQKSDGVVLRTGRLKRYIEYTLETDFLPEVFHRQLVEVLSTARNMIINGKQVEFGGDYQIDWQNKQDCFAKATCKIIERIGSPVRC